MLFKQELIVLLSAAAPISEIRGAIPIGVLLFKMEPLKVMALAVLGNMLPIMPLLFFLERFSVFIPGIGFLPGYLNIPGKGTAAIFIIGVGRPWLS